MKYIKILFGHIFRNSPTSKSTFSEFFTDFSSGERTKIVRNAIREANTEQKVLVEKYKREYAS